MRWAILGFGLSMIAATASAQLIEAPGFRVDGNNFIKLSKESQTIYVLGVSEGFMTAAWMGVTLREIDAKSAAANKYIQLRDCVNDWTAEQSRDIMLKYIRDFPEERHFPLASLFALAAGKACALK